MSDKPVVHIGENSAEQVAYRLMEAVARVERKSFYHGSHSQGETTADRKWILDTFAECMLAVRQPHGRS